MVISTHLFLLCTMEHTVINGTYTIQSTDIYELKKYRKYFMRIIIGELQS